MSKRNLKPIAAAVGTAFLASLATTSIAHASDNPFSVQPLEAGYLLAAADAAEGKCGEEKAAEGKCGEDKAAEGKCGEDEAADTKCGEDGKGPGCEGKCGEGKCGEGKCGEGE